MGGDGIQNGVIWGGGFTNNDVMNMKLIIKLRGVL
jgi:hypothetical protein